MEQILLNWYDFKLYMLPFTEDVIDIIRSIPPGSVATYGQIAALAGSPRAARQVSRILHSMSQKYNLPWHRVINAQGKIVINDIDGKELQRIKLEEEGVIVSNQYTINLDQYQWDIS